MRASPFCGGSEYDEIEGCRGDGGVLLCVLLLGGDTIWLGVPYDEVYMWNKETEKGCFVDYLNCALGFNARTVVLVSSFFFFFYRNGMIMVLVGYSFLKRFQLFFILSASESEISKNCRSSQSAKPTANIRLYIRE